MSRRIIVHLSSYVIPSSVYDAMYNITTKPKTFLQQSAYHVTNAEMLYELSTSWITLIL